MFVAFLILSSRAFQYLIVEGKKDWLNLLVLHGQLVNLFCSNKRKLRLGLQVSMLQLRYFGNLFF